MQINFEEALNSILEITGHTITDTVKTRRKILYHELFRALLIAESFKDVAELLDLTPDIIEKTMSRYVSKEFPDKPRLVKWNNYLYSLIGCKKCNKCCCIKTINENFVKDLTTWDGFSRACKECKAVLRSNFTDNNPDYNSLTYQKNKSDYIARAIQYKTKRSLATPLWADLTKIKEIYDTCPEGYHVDHIIPLQGELVCGLHVEYNLRHLPALENMQKHNKFEPH